MVTKEEFGRLKEDMDTCRIDVYKDIKELKHGHKELSITLREQAVLRKEYNDTVNKKLDSLADIIYGHTGEEMETIREIKEALNTLVDQTAINTNYITSETYNKELERRMDEREAERNKPRDEMIHKAKMTAIGVATTAFVASMGSIIYAGIQMWFTLGMDKI